MKGDGTGGSFKDAREKSIRFEQWLTLVAELIEEEIPRAHKGYWRERFETGQEPEGAALEYKQGKQP